MRSVEPTKMGELASGARLRKKNIASLRHIRTLPREVFGGRENGCPVWRKTATANAQEVEGI